MRMLGRTATVLGLACLVQVPAVVAQTTGFESFRWYVGAQAGLIIFETPSQTRGGIFAAGAHVLITARRTGLLLSVEEGIKRNQLSSFADTTATGGVRQLVFNDLRKYSATLLAFPLRTIVQPYFGVGVGWLQTVKNYPQGTSSSFSQGLAESAASMGFGSLTAGVQTRVDRIMLFGQYQITTGAPSGKLLTGPTHTLTAGIRFGLGSAREDIERGTGAD
ncbi:MAG TPA: hypothetical protein VMG41_02825 [Gemmatimonadales bacterium]|nr:hypothetical protein [Gemmatimonadales bacterium]